MILTLLGHTAIAESVYKEDFYMMWGGLPDDVKKKWDTDGIPPADPLSTELLKPVGVLRNTSKIFVTPDNNGELTTTDVDGITLRKWSSSPTPTRHIYLQFKFLQSYNPNDIIRQTGLFIGTTFTENPEHEYHTAGSIENPGKLMYMENLEKEIVRTIANREIFEFVLTY